MSFKKDDRQTVNQNGRMAICKSEIKSICARAPLKKAIISSLKLSKCLNFMKTLLVGETASLLVALLLQRRFVRFGRRFKLTRKMAGADCRPPQPPLNIGRMKTVLAASVRGLCTRATVSLPPIDCSSFMPDQPDSTRSLNDHVEELVPVSGLEAT